MSIRMVSEWDAGGHRVRLVHRTDGTYLVAVYVPEAYEASFRRFFDHIERFPEPWNEGVSIHGCTSVGLGLSGNGWHYMGSFDGREAPRTDLAAIEAANDFASYVIPHMRGIYERNGGASIA